MLCDSFYCVISFTAVVWNWTHNIPRCTCIYTESTDPKCPAQCIFEMWKHWHCQFPRHPAWAPFPVLSPRVTQHREFWWNSLALLLLNFIYMKSWEKKSFTCDLFCSALHARFIHVAVHSCRSFILILPFWMYPNLFTHPTVDSQSMRKLIQYQEEGQDLLVK